MTRAEIQQRIMAETGIKTSVKKLSGSMKLYTCFSPMFQDGKYPQLPIEWLREFKRQFPVIGSNSGCFVSGTSIDILTAHIQEGEATKFKKERKVKPIDPDKVSKGWGSKNSQMRLDKAGERFGAKLRREGRSYFM